MNPDKKTLADEPTALITAVTTAATASLGILLALGVDPDLVASLIGAVSGWIAAAGIWLRTRVTPTKNVGATVAEVRQLDALSDADLLAARELKRAA